MMKQFWIGLRLFLWLTLITGVIYPLAITGVANILFFEKAQGSIIVRDGKKIGSKFIAQKFSEEKYFWPRPSANDYNALKSSGSNLSPSSLRLKEVMQKRAAAYAEKEVPPALLFASGSGLDPDISLYAAYFQVDRVAKARGINPEEVKELIEKLRTYSYVNVLELNLALDERFKK